MNIKISPLQKLIAMTSLIAAGVIPAFRRKISLGEFAGQTDIGSPKLAGARSYDAANQAYTIAGAGINMWFTNDQCHFVWKKLKGDFILRTRVEFVGKGAVEHRKIGWMVRPNLDSRCTLRGLRGTWQRADLDPISPRQGSQHGGNQAGDHQRGCAPV